MLANQILESVLEEHGGNFDADSRSAYAWFKQYRFAYNDYGDDKTISRANRSTELQWRSWTVMQMRM